MNVVFFTPFLAESNAPSRMDSPPAPLVYTSRIGVVPPGELLHLLIRAQFTSSGLYLCVSPELKELLIRRPPSTIPFRRPENVVIFCRASADKFRLSFPLPFFLLLGKIESPGFRVVMTKIHSCSVPRRVPYFLRFLLLFGSLLEEGVFNASPHSTFLQAQPFSPLYWRLFA